MRNRRDRRDGGAGESGRTSARAVNS
jgi:hypothetical protein